MSNILNDLSNYIPTKDKHIIIEERVKNAIASVKNVMELIDDNFSSDDANELKRRIYLSIKNDDIEKFTRKIREMKKEENYRND